MTSIHRDTAAGRAPLVILGLTVAAVLGSRIAGPSDLYDQDQPKTVAYTVDAVKNGRWVLPRDMLGRPATKPPMFNWIGSPFVALGWTSEWALKMPSVLAAIVVLVAVYWMGNRMVVGMGSVAGVWWLANLSGVKLSYLARPDMVLTAFLTVGWICATVLLLNAGGRGRNVLRLALWGSVAGAVLTKGPPALLLVFYVLLGARLIAGQWRAVNRTGIAWGLPLALVVAGLWLWGARAADSEHFAKHLVGSEVVNRVAGEEYGGPLALLMESWLMPAWFMSWFMPGSVFVVLTLVHVPPRRWFRHATAPMTLWVLLVVLFFSLSAGKRADYLAPAYPVASILAAYWLMEVGKKYQLTAARAALAGAVVAVGFCIYFLVGSPAARTGLGENVKDFAARVAKTTAAEPIVFLDTGYNPLQSLLGRNQASRQPSDPQLARARWIIRPYVEGDGAAVVLTSRPIPTRDGKIEVLGLFPADGAYNRGHAGPLIVVDP